MSPGDLSAPSNNCLTQEDEQEGEAQDDGSLDSYTAPLIYADTRPPVIPSTIRPASEPTDMSMVGREFHPTAAQPPWLGGTLNDKPEPVAPIAFPSPVFCTPQAQDGAQNIVRWNVETERHNIQAGYCNLAGGGVSIHDRAPEWEQRGITRSPGFPLAVPSISPSLSTSMCQCHLSDSQQKKLPPRATSHGLGCKPQRP